MKRAPFIFLGIFSLLAFSWTGLLLSNQISYGNIRPHVDEVENKAFPLPMTGVAAQGQIVYQDLGCVYCHTQQVRRPDIASDIERGWGNSQAEARPSVARDYLREARVQLGSLRIGADLRNVGARKPDGDRAYDAVWHYKHLYDPQLTSKGSVMPSYRFLFERRKIVGQPSTNAISLPAPYTADAGYEIVPTARGEALVAYLLSLKDTYAYPEEAQKVYVPKKDDKNHHEAKPEGHK
jgi:cytochrome c oxidase cbb3-type subunit 2